jgi:Arc/MetJ family transcription regulator
MEAARWPIYVKETRPSNQKPMRTTIDIDDALMRKAMRLSGLTTKKAVVEAALRLLIQTHSQASPLNVKGVKLGVSTADLVAVVREGRERR